MGCSNSKIAAEVAALIERNAELASMHSNEIKDRERVEQTIVSHQKLIEQNIIAIEALEVEKEQLNVVIRQQKDLIFRLKENETARLKAEALAEAQEILRRMKLAEAEKIRHIKFLAAEFVTSCCVKATELALNSLLLQSTKRRCHHHYHRDGTVSEKPWVKTRSKRYHRSKKDVKKEYLPEVKPIENIEPIDIDVSKREVYHTIYTPGQDRRSPQELTSGNAMALHYHRKIKCWTGSCVDDYSSDEEDQSPENKLASYGLPGIFQDDSIISNNTDTPQEFKPDIVWSSSLKRYVTVTDSDINLSFEQEYKDVNGQLLYKQ